MLFPYFSDTIATFLTLEGFAVLTGKLSMLKCPTACHVPGEHKRCAEMPAVNHLDQTFRSSGPFVGRNWATEAVCAFLT
jgi:hypothetical protein